MSQVDLRTVSEDEDGLRLDRWFRRHYPDIPHGHLQRWLRTGQVRVDGRRAAAGDRLGCGQRVRVPPRSEPKPHDTATMPQAAKSNSDRQLVESWIIHRDDDVIVMNKPHGLAVQGGSKVRRHLDLLLTCLASGDVRPKLVHRLDKDTSGIVVVARTLKAAAHLSHAFRSREVAKLYWAIVVGVPTHDYGEIDAPLNKRPGLKGDRVGIDLQGGLRAMTRYRVLERAGKLSSWLELEPMTGRTHQLRVHCAALSTPILGDGKYGGRESFLELTRLSGSLHLHARALMFPHPGGGMFRVAAPLPPHMLETWKFFGFAEESEAETLRRWKV